MLSKANRRNDQSLYFDCHLARSISDIRHLLARCHPVTITRPLVANHSIISLFVKLPSTLKLPTFAPCISLQVYYDNKGFL